MNLTEKQLRGLRNVAKVCNDYDACCVGWRVSRSVAESLVKKGLVEKVVGGFVSGDIGFEERRGVGYAVTSAGRDLLGRKQ